MYKLLFVLLLKICRLLHVFIRYTICQILLSERKFTYLLAYLFILKIGVPKKQLVILPPAHN